MDSQQVLQAMRQGQRDPNWVVFHYNKTRAILMLLYKIFFAGLLLGLSGALFILSPKPLSQDTKFLLVPLTLVGAIGLIVLLHHIYTMFFLKSNMIVLTQNEIVKSVRGKVYAWSYDHITDLKLAVTHIKNSPPVYSIEFNDASQNGRIFELARGREFGPAQNIYEILKTKIK